MCNIHVAANMPHGVQGARWVVLGCAQEPVLFAASIEENIVYGSENATRGQVERAAKMANAHDFILRIPDGYKAQVTALKDSGRPQVHTA